jgi:hypothetical protein
MSAVHRRYCTVDGYRPFFGEAGNPSAPALVLLHGFPTSSYMFRDLVPALADRYHVITRPSGNPIDSADETGMHPTSRPRHQSQQPPIRGRLLGLN